MPDSIHQHHWQVDRMQAGFSCPCGQPAFDWLVDEVKRLKAENDGLSEDLATALDAEKIALRVIGEDNARLRAELAVWQQRFGDCQATVMRMEAVVSEARKIEAVDHGVGWPDLAHAVHVLDAVPRRAGTGEIRIYPHRFIEPCGSQEGTDACWYDGKPRLDPIHAAEIREPAASPEDVA